MEKTNLFIFLGYGVFCYGIGILVASLDPIFQNRDSLMIAVVIMLGAVVSILIGMVKLK